MLVDNTLPVFAFESQKQYILPSLKEELMTEGTFSRKLRFIACIVGCWLGLAATVSAADIQMQVQAAPGQPSVSSPTGKVLTIEDAVRIGLENHPRIKSSSERVGSQQAVLGQQMSAYYPTISLTNLYRSGTASGTTGVSPTGFDFFQSQASFNMTLYNFGKREGNVQAARETLDATRKITRAPPRTSCWP